MTGEIPQLPAGPEQPSDGRRELSAAVTATVAGAALALLSGTQSWAHVRVRQVVAGPAGESLLDFSTALSGRTIAPAVTAWGLLALAAVLAISATRGIGRRLTGALLAVAGLAEIAAALVVRADPREHALETAPVRRAVSTFEPMSVVVRTTPWLWVAVAGGVVLLAAGAFVLARGPRWAGMSARYERPAGPGFDAPAGAPRDVPPADEAAWWDEIDRGGQPGTPPG